MRTIAFWLDDAPRPADLPTADLPAATDVLVVGAGVTGLNAARELARLGVDVTVVEAGSVGSGASAINGGQINYGLKASTRSVFRRHGPELGRRLWDASLAAIEHVERLVTEERIDCGFRRVGAAELAYRDRDLEELESESRWMREHLGFDTTPVPRKRMTDVVGSPVFACALLDDTSAAVHPARYLFGLARATARRGARIVEDARVRAVERGRVGFRVATAKGTVVAGTVLMATNGYTPADVVPAIRRRVVPIGSYMVATVPLGDALAREVIPSGRVCWTSRRLLNYFRLSDDGRLLLGGRQDLSVGLDPVASAEELQRTMVTLFPQLDGVEITHTWGGNLGATFDLLPHIGRIGGVWFAMGYGGHGLGLGSYVGAEAGRLIGGELDKSPFAEIPAPTRPWYRRSAWFLPIGARWWRFLDRIGR